ncbi:MAG: polyprenyl diphosphate synthase, partial [Candidatus Heimdallarchaeota archaeon]
YVFSTENFNRDPEEVTKIMELLVEKLIELYDDPMIIDNKVKVKIIGRRDDLSKKIISLIDQVEEKTKDFKKYLLNVALSYGGRVEIIDAVKEIAQKVKDNTMKINEIDEKVIDDHLYTKGIPDPDLIIRTSGEERLSGFLLWQSAYSELYFTDIYWPAFRRIDLWRAIRIFQQRERRYGK